MIIAPSVLSLDYSDTKKQLDELQKNGIKWIHFDVMDGHFVPNLSFGPHILKTISKAYAFYYDVHLMVEKPQQFINPFIESGANSITFHQEVLKSEEEGFKMIEQLHQKNIKAGMSIKPNTSIEMLRPYLKQLDLILLMSVEPGFGGQAFIEETLIKIKDLKNMMVSEGVCIPIQVDGGINAVTKKQCEQQGAEIFVVGSYLFKENIQKALESLC